MTTIHPEVPPQIVAQLRRLPRFARSLRRGGLDRHSLYRVLAPRRLLAMLG